MPLWNLSQFQTVKPWDALTFTPKHNRPAIGSNSITKRLQITYQFTRNQAGSPKGKKWGLKVYDGQRVPSGTQLLTQNQLRTMPGWNVSRKSHNLLIQ